MCMPCTAPHHHPATPCNTLQHPATLCNTLQHSATPCNTLQHTATLKCNMIAKLEYALGHRIKLQNTATHDTQNVIQDLKCILLLKA